jgi:hypothetical protein
MKKNLLFTLSIVVFISSICFAQWVSLDKFSNPGSEPVVQLISDDASSTVIKIDLPGFQINEFTANGQTYHSLSFDSQAITREVGFPEIPYIAKILAIPDQGSVSIEVLETSAIQTFEGINISPARESWEEGKPETPYMENMAAYLSADIYPKNFAKVEDPAILRDFRIARVSIFPIRYSPEKKEIQAVSSITIKVNYIPGLGINHKTTSQRPIAPSFDKIYRNSIFNYGEVLQRRYGGQVTGYDFMLCIMPDEYYDSFQVYANWKHKTGTFIHCTKFSEIGATPSNYTAVKDHILDAYNNWPVTPTHVLILGDYGYAPVKYWTGDGWTFVNEDYFVELDGSDYFPEMFIGRFAHQTDYRLQVMINKFLSYEKTPYVQNTDWFKKGLVCSDSEYPSMRTTKRFTANEMVNFGNFTSVDSVWDGNPCYGNVTTILNYLNQGRSFLNYRGQGWSSGWNPSHNCIPFHTSDLSSLNNGQMSTFVTSIGCGVAMFDASGGNCFGEEFTEMGTPTEIRGACAFVGPTSNTHTAYNNNIDRGIYISMFEPGIGTPQNVDSPGESLLAGKLLMYSVFGGGDPYVEYHFKIYCILGDPSLHVWKDVPQNITVIHPDTIYVGYSQAQINVKYSGTGLPVNNAQVCISGNDVYEVETTDQSGNAILNINTSSLGELNIAVRGATVIPYEGTIQVVQGVENIAPANDPVVTDIDGNLDGLIDPNENCTITFTLKNYGTVIANDVFATVDLPDTVNQVEIITTDPVSFGTIAPGQSVTGSPYQFFVTPECPVGFVIPFQLSVVSSTSDWNYYQNELVHGCLLKYNSYFIDDDGNVLRNFRMDPGETVKVILEIANQGDDVAPDVKGILRCNNQYITILDSVGTFGTLLPDSSKMNDLDYFVAKVSEDCPVQYSVDYTIELSTQNGLYPYSEINNFQIPVAMPSGFDPTGPDEYGYYAYSSDDILFEQSPQYNWVEINTIGTQISVPSGGNYTQTVSLPFTFKHYGNSFSQLRISSDGWIAPGSGSQIAPVNEPLPNQDDINNMIGAFWDDLFSSDPGEIGKLYYYNDASNHRFIIEWDQVGHADDYTNKETFEILLLDPAYYPTQTGDGEILFQYNTVDEPGSCTVGIEDNTETIGLQYVYNELYAITATQIRDEFAIKFTTDSATVVSVKGENEITSLPTDYVLEQNYPNPFNPQTRISYSIPEPAYVKLSIYDINGTLVKTLLEGNQSAGRYEAEWDGKNSSGVKVGSGVYFYRLQANSFAQVKKMILLK